MRTLAVVMLAFILFGCKHLPTNPTDTNLTLPDEKPPASNKLVIQTDSSIYRWILTEGSPIVFVSATLTSTSKDTFYAKLGDGLVLDEQGCLYVAEGSDGYIEKREPDGTWIAKGRSHLVEGVRAVAIRPSQEYPLQTFLQWQTTEKGVFRIKINYYPHVDSIGGTQGFVDYSNAFVIQ